MRLLSFDEFSIDRDAYTLTRAGKPVRIGAKALDLLICLIENRDRVLDRQFLRNELWNAAQLSQSTIPMCVREIRRALGDRTSSPRYIESVRSRGYRFIGKLSQSSHTRLYRDSAIPFIGRALQLRTLLDAVRDTRATGKGQLFAIGGEAGIGKSRLLSEFRHALRDKVPVVMARTPRFNEAEQFWPWTQILQKAYSNSETSADTPGALERPPKLVQTGFLKESAEANTPDRLTALSQWLESILALANKGVVVLCIDDFHRADRDAQQLANWIAEELDRAPIVIVATHRPLAYNANFERPSLLEAPEVATINLPPLSPEDITAFLDPFTPNREKTGGILFERTGGNPFYATHLARSMESLSALCEAQTGSGRLPLNAQEIVARQVTDLPDETVRWLSAAAIIGEEATVELIAATLQSDPDIAPRILEPAVLSGFVTLEYGTILFRHALLREALERSPVRVEKRRIHLLAAKSLQHATESNAPLSRIADHLFEAIPMGSTTEVVQASIRAGREAMNTMAFPQAEIFFRRAHTLSIRNGILDRESMFRILVDFATASLFTGDRAEARALLLEAAKIARKLNTPESIAECALRLAPDFLSIEIGGLDPALISLLEEALAQVDSESICTRAHLLARLSQARRWDLNDESSERLADESVALARRSGNREALISALAARCEALSGPQRSRERLRVAKRLERETAGSQHERLNLLQRTRVMSALLELGDVRGFEVCNRGFREATHQPRLRTLRWLPIAYDSMLAMLHGQIDLAEMHARDYLACGEAVVDGNFFQIAGCQSAIRAIENDRSESAVASVAAFARSRSVVLAWSAALAWLQWDSGDIDGARATAERFASRDIFRMLNEAGGGVGIASLAEVAARLNIVHLIGPLGSALTRIRNRYASAGYGVVYLGSFARYHGLVSLAAGRVNEAIQSLETAIRAESRVGAPSWRGYAEVDLIAASNKHLGMRDKEAHIQLSNVARRAAECRLPRLRRVAHDALEPTLTIADVTN